jgi:hypothetical protein
MAIFWILHKPLSVNDWTNDIEGPPGFFYDYFSDLIFWDISELGCLAKAGKVLIPRKIEVYNTAPMKVAGRYRVIVKKNLNKYILKTESSDIFVFQTYSKGAYNYNILLRALTKIGRKTLLLKHWVVPYTDLIPPKNKWWIIQFLRRSKKAILYSLLNKLINILYFGYNNRSTNVFDYVFSCGNEITNITSRQVNIKSIIPAHSVTYDQWLILKSGSKLMSKPVVKDKFYVYIDQALTVHVDALFMNSKNASKMFQIEIKNTLEFLENKLNTKIVIANHPRCQYPAGFWGDREVYTGMTQQLIEESIGVIGHMSTIMSMAVLEKKKRIFLTSSSLYFLWTNEVIMACSYLGGDILDMNTLEYTQANVNNNIKLTDYFSLCPQSTETNKEKLIKFFREHNENSYSGI